MVNLLIAQNCANFLFAFLEQFHHDFRIIYMETIGNGLTCIQAAIFV